jgi:tRNA(Ile)-lysidine synthase
MLSSKGEVVPKTSPKGKLVERVLAFIRQHSLVSARETLVVGVSGGPDSACLVHLVATLKERLDIGLHVAHLDHMLRGAESEADAQYVSELARHLGLAVTLERRDVKSYHERHHLSLEEAARQVRYQFFADVAGKVGASKIAVGHTSDDQAETILMRLVRGAGNLGLQGMQPLTEWDTLGGNTGLKIIRPLLGVSRKDVEAYCRKHALAPRQDSSNLSRSYLRNRIRSELMPLLRSYNPKIDEALLRTADTLAAESAFFEQQVSQVWDKVVNQEGEALVLQAKELKSLHPALQRHLLREVLRRLLGSLDDVEWQHIEKMRYALALPRGKRVVLLRGLTLYVERGRYRVAVD